MTSPGTMLERHYIAARDLALVRTIMPMAQHMCDSEEAYGKMLARK